MRDAKWARAVESVATSIGTGRRKRSPRRVSTTGRSRPASVATLSGGVAGAGPGAGEASASIAITPRTAETAVMRSSLDRPRSRSGRARAALDERHAFDVEGVREHVHRLHAQQD